MTHRVTCEQVQARLAALADGECEHDEAVRMEAHCAVCRECARHREDQTGVRWAVGEWQVETVDLWPSLEARIETESSRDSLAELRAEMAQMKAQLARLEHEVFLLRRAAMPAVATPSPLLPYTAAASRSLHLA